MIAGHKTVKKGRPRTRPSSKTAARAVSFGLPRVGTFRFSVRKNRQNQATLINFTIEIHPPNKSRRSRASRDRRLNQDNYYPEIIWNWLRYKLKPAHWLILVSLAGALYFSAHLQKPAHFNIAQPAAKVLAARPAPVSKSLPASIPVELKIPKIGLDTQLKQTGTDANGAISMPWDIEEADWYKYSPTPGQIGPSIIVGHLDGANYANMAGVFYRLNQLAPGDQIAVIRADGSTAAFKVIYLRQVPQSNFPSKEIYGNIKYAGIRLITCGGTFDDATGHYTDNTVVFGALE